MSFENNAKRTQEQATAAWVEQLNKLRIDEMFLRLSKQNLNFKSAWNELQELKTSILEEVVSRGRGGQYGMHGFIGERCQVYIENARKLIDGLGKEYILIDDNGAVDYLHNGIPIQQKCVREWIGFEAIKKHFEKYPDFVKNGGKYQIPQDFYDKYKKLMSLSKEELGDLRREDYRLWKKINEVFKETGLDYDQIEPMVVDYEDIQRDTVNSTIEREKDHIKEKDKSNREKIKEEAKPSVNEGIKTTAISAAIEGITALVTSIIKKHKQGKKFADFTEDDWKEVFAEAGIGTGKGAVRGSVTYIISNKTKISAPVASAMVTAMFGVMSEAYKLRDGNTTVEDFVLNSEGFCLEVSLNALAAVIGSAVIPVPVLGAVVGSAVGNFMVDIAKTTLSENEQNLIEEYAKKLRQLEDELDEKYKKVVKEVDEKFKRFSSTVEFAFDTDINLAFEGSVNLAIEVGVPNDKILKTKEDINRYFMD